MLFRVQVESSPPNTIASFQVELPITIHMKNYQAWESNLVGQKFPSLVTPKITVSSGSTIMSTSSPSSPSVISSSSCNLRYLDLPDSVAPYRSHNKNNYRPGSFPGSRLSCSATSHILWFWYEEHVQQLLVLKCGAERFIDTKVNETKQLLHHHLISAKNIDRKKEANLIYPLGDYDQSSSLLIMT